MQPDFCWWCDAKVKVSTPHDYKTTRVFCSKQCQISNWMFNKLYLKGVVNATNQKSNNGEEET